MEVIGEYEDEVSCGTCGARLKFKAPDIWGHTSTRSTLPQYGEEPTRFNWDIYCVTCGNCQATIEISDAASVRRLPKKVSDEVKAKRWR